MTVRAASPERCLLCHRRIEHWTHQPWGQPGLLYRLLHLIWPRWLWRRPGEQHMFVSKLVRMMAQDELLRQKRRLQRRTHG